MSTLVYVNSNNGLAKNALEAVTYGKKFDGDVTVVTTGGADASTLATLGEYGAKKVLVDRSVTSNEPGQRTQEKLQSKFWKRRSQKVKFHYQRQNSLFRRVAD